MAGHRGAGWRGLPLATLLLAVLLVLHNAYQRRPNLQARGGERRHGACWRGARERQLGTGGAALPHDHPPLHAGYVRQHRGQHHAGRGAGDGRALLTHHRHDAPQNRCVRAGGDGAAAPCCAALLSPPHPPPSTACFWMSGTSQMGCLMYYFAYEAGLTSPTYKVCACV